jgi:hypothetical protein
MVTEHPMNEEQYRLRLICAVEHLISAARRCGGDRGFLTASCTDQDGRGWRILVRRDPVVPVASITPPAPVVFGQN